jgi:hypothetical protein
LEASFHQSSVNLRALLRFRVFLEISFKIPNQSGTVVCGVFDRLLEFLLG